MKKPVFIFCCIFLFNSYSFAEENTVLPQSSIQAEPKFQNQTFNDNDDDMQGPDNFYNEIILQKYGSNQSPSFDDRDVQNPNEADYGYGSF